MYNAAPSNHILLPEEAYEVESGSEPVQAGPSPGPAVSAAQPHEMVQPSAAPVPISGSTAVEMPFSEVDPTGDGDELTAFFENFDYEHFLGSQVSNEMMQPDQQSGVSVATAAETAQLPAASAPSRQSPAAEMAHWAGLNAEIDQGLGFEPAGEMMPPNGFDFGVSADGNAETVQLPVAPAPFSPGFGSGMPSIPQEPANNAAAMGMAFGEPEQQSAAQGPWNDPFPGANDMMALGIQPNFFAAQPQEPVQYPAAQASYRPDDAAGMYFQHPENGAFVAPPQMPVQQYAAPVQFPDFVVLEVPLDPQGAAGYVPAVPAMVPAVQPAVAQPDFARTYAEMDEPTKEYWRGVLDERMRVEHDWVPRRARAEPCKLRIRAIDLLVAGREDQADKALARHVYKQKHQQRARALKKGQVLAGPAPGSAPSPGA